MDNSRAGSTIPTGLWEKKLSSFAYFPHPFPFSLPMMGKMLELEVERVSLLTMLRLLYGFCLGQQQLCFQKANRISDGNEIRKQNLNILFHLRGLTRMNFGKSNQCVPQYLPLESACCFLFINILIVRICPLLWRLLSSHK